MIIQKSLNNKFLLIEKINNLISEEINQLSNLINENQIYIYNSALEISRILSEAINNNKTIFICGNGGSASQGEHFSGELIGRFEKKRPPFKAISLTSDSSAITCISNDFGFKEIFARQLNSLASESDVLICLSTSGKSENIINALIEAKKKKMIKIGFFGSKVEKAKSLTDLNFIVNSCSTARIQEIHLLAIHCICKIIDFEFSK